MRYHRNSLQAAPADNLLLKATGKQLRTVQDLENVMKAASQSPDQVLFMTGVYPSGRRANYAVDLSQAE